MIREGKKIAIVLPSYNEEKNLGLVLSDIVQNNSLAGCTVVVIDDGSHDATADIAQSFERVVLVQHPFNKGLAATFRTAVNWCLDNRMDVMVFFDADGQFEASDIPRVAQPVLESKYDFSLGSRFLIDSPKNIPLAKLYGNAALAWFISGVTKQRVRDVACGFRAYSREALLRINLTGEFTYTQEVILDLLFKGLRYIEVPITAHYNDGQRPSAISGNLSKYGWRVFKIMARTIRDYQPMRFFGWIGSLLFVLGFALDIWILWHFFSTGSFTPYKAVGFTGAFLNFMGITIWFIGLVADMLNRIRKNQEEILYRMKKIRCS